MKCTACGLPLSPSRVRGNCPRCGTPVGAGTKSMGGSVGGYGNAPAPVNVGAPPLNEPWGQAQPVSAFQPPMVLPPHQSQQPGQTWGANANGMQGPGTFSPMPMPPVPGGSPRRPRFGFVVAGIFVCVGGLLLVLVYFLATGQLNNYSTASVTPTRTAATSTAAVTPSPAASPTVTTYPGQQYISNAQMSSAKPSASQSAQPATSFKVNQTLYVVFKVSSSSPGEVCLKWYLNGKFAFNFQFPIGAHATFTTYGQAVYSTPGPAYVELYWAGDASCTNELLAQHVDFTITQ